MSEGATAFALMMLCFVCFVAFLVAVAGAFFFRKSNKPAWKGFVLGGFTGTLAGMASLAILFLIYF